MFVQYSNLGTLTGRIQFWEQTTIFGTGSTEAGDRFGFALAAGNFNGGLHDDLAIGVPLEDILNIRDAGEVDVIYGSATGLSTTGRAPQIWHQNTTNIEDSIETNDQFGSSLTAWNFGRNEARRPPPDFFLTNFQTADLAIGVPLENIGTIGDAGAVNVIYGSIVPMV